MAHASTPLRRRPEPSRARASSPAGPLAGLLACLLSLAPARAGEWNLPVPSAPSGSRFT